MSSIAAIVSGGFKSPRILICLRRWLFRSRYVSRYETVLWSPHMCDQAIFPCCEWVKVDYEKGWKVTTLQWDCAPPQTTITEGSEVRDIQSQTAVAPATTTTVATANPLPVVCSNLGAWFSMCLLFSSHFSNLTTRLVLLRPSQRDWCSFGEVNNHMRRTALPCRRSRSWYAQPAELAVKLSNVFTVLRLDLWAQPMNITHTQMIESQSRRG